MSVLPFLAITFGAAAASLLLRANAKMAAAIGIAGLLAAAAAAARIQPEDTLVIGGSELAGSEYLRLFALIGSLVALALTVLGLASVSHRNAPGVLLAGMGSAVLAMALTDARIAVLAATAGGLVGILVTIASPATPRSVVVASRELRALAVAGVLAILATAWIGRPLGGLAVVPEVFGFAYLGFAAAVAIRFGAIPFHFWAARLADAAPEVTLPMLMAWGPAAFAIVALTWADQSIAPLHFGDAGDGTTLLPLTAERIAIVAVGAASAVLGMIAAAVQDDLEHVVGYTIIADAGVAILGLAALSPDAWSPAREWILVFVTVRSAFAAWAVAVRGAFRSRRISDLGGWAVRAPLLAVALVIVAAAAVGFPGLVAWEARSSLVDLTIAGPIGIIVVLSSIAQLAIYGRLLLVGLSKPSAAVIAGLSERPTWPEIVERRDVVGLSRAERAFERGGHAIGGGLDVLWGIPEAIRANRALLAGAIAVLVAALALSLSAGGFGVVEASQAVPAPGGPGPAEGPGAPSGAPSSEAPSSEPPASESPVESVPPSEVQPSGSPVSPGSAPPSAAPSASPS